MDLSVGSPLTTGLILGVVITAALLITVERRLLGFWQERLGPNRVGWFALGVSVADMIKIYQETGYRHLLISLVGCSRNYNDGGALASQSYLSALT